MVAEVILVLSASNNFMHGEAFRTLSLFSGLANQIFS